MPQVTHPILDVLTSMYTTKQTVRTKDLTLACIDCVNPDLAAFALDVSTRGISFDRVVLFSHVQPKNTNIEWVEIPKLSFDAYQLFTLKELHKYITTSHVLTIQTDGFVVQPQLFDPIFQTFDYIGAPWNDAPYSKKTRVGNSGFCIRSKRFLETTAKLTTTERLKHSKKLHNTFCDDHFVCNELYDDLIRQGLIFAPPEIAGRFSSENETEWSGNPRYSFGCHGKWHQSTNWLKEMFTSVNAYQINIAVNWYTSNDPIRQEELDRCLRNNMKMGHVTLLSDCTPPNWFRGTFVRIDGRASFGQLVDCLNRCNGLKVLLNADCWCDASIGKLCGIDDNTFACLTRHELEPDGTWKLWERGAHFSQDVWCWKGIARFSPNGLLLGTVGCDNRIACMAKNAGYTLINPSRSIVIHHEHSQAQRSALPRVQGDYTFVWPHLLGQVAKTQNSKAKGNSGPSYRLKGQEITHRA